MLVPSLISLFLGCPTAVDTAEECWEPIDNFCQSPACPTVTEVSREFENIAGECFEADCPAGDSVKLQCFDNTDSDGDRSDYYYNGVGELIAAEFPHHGGGCLNHTYTYGEVPDGCRPYIVP